VTFQYAWKVASNVFVIASDTLCSIIPEVEEDVDHPNPTASEHRTKMSLCEKHQMVIAHAGFMAQIGANPSKELADHLAQVFSGNDSNELKRVLREWGDVQGRRFARDKFLIVTPRTAPDQLLKLSMFPDCHVWTSSQFFSGDERNSAVFWPSFFKVDDEDYDLEQSLSIAAATIVMAQKISAGYIGGLDMWYCHKGQWKYLDSDHCRPLRWYISKQGAQGITQTLLKSGINLAIP
jgi:hypothetical protein